MHIQGVTQKPPRPYSQPNEHTLTPLIVYDTQLSSFEDHQESIGFLQELSSPPDKINLLANLPFWKEVGFI
jgi:hypothetical protein